MEEKGLAPLIFVAGVLTAAGIFKAKRYVKPALQNTKVFFAHKRERLEDVFSKVTAKKKKR